MKILKFSVMAHDVQSALTVITVNSRTECNVMWKYDRCVRADHFGAVNV